MDQPISQPVPLYIGREKTRKNGTPNDIPLRQERISQDHAKLTIYPKGDMLLEDTDSKHGTAWQQEDGSLIPLKKKWVAHSDTILFAGLPYQIETILPEAFKTKSSIKQDPLDYRQEFAALTHTLGQYRTDRRQARNLERQIKVGSVVGASLLGIASFTLRAQFQWLGAFSSLGLGVLVPTLASTLLNTEDKLERLEAQHRETYRCPNKTACSYSFGNTPWTDLALRKKCPNCKAIWVD